MDSERGILCKAISGRHLDELVARQVEPDHFADEDCRKVYRTMLAHLARYGEPPGPEAISEAHPEFPITISGEGMDYHMDRFLRGVKRRTAINLYRDFGDAIEDPERVLEIEVVAMEMASTLMDIIPQERAGLYSDADKRIQRYLDELEEGQPKGLLLGFPKIDRQCAGIRPHEFWVVAGWQNAGKSFVMQRMAWHIYSELRKRPLFISLEMSEEECFARFDSMAGNLEQMALSRMEIEPHSPEMERWRQQADLAKQFRAERDIKVIDDIGSCTPDRVLVEARRYEPDVVFVDYLELMDPPRQADLWQGIDMIGRQLKRNSRLRINGRHIPIVVAAQTNKDDGGKGANLGNISYKSTGKHADVVLGITRTDEMERQERMELWVHKNRRGPRGFFDDLTFMPERAYLEPAGEERFPRRRARRENPFLNRGQQPPQSEAA